MHACAKANDPSRAEVWLQKMSDEGLTANAIIYNLVIDACAKTGEVQKAEAWLMKMINANVAVDVVSYSAVIDACAKIGDHGGGVALGHDQVRHRAQYRGLQLGHQRVGQGR